ncbi:MAG: Uma2 family endonuclease [Candidatus Poribacteria bacterium]|nr:Uma2 family endonuclease [Candidatus Poribacteria bacterium]
MNTLNDFEFKQKKYMPTFPKAIGKPTIYIEGYPCEDDEPMAATDFHAEQITTFSDQLKRYFAINELVHIAVDSFIYYSEGDITKCVAPDIHIVFGVDKYPLRRSFYTWAEGAAPVAVFEFLSDSTVHQDRNEKVGVYLNDIGVQEYFIHQPEMKKPAEFQGWRRSPSGDIVEMNPDAEGGLFSEVLNLWFRWKEDQTTHVRLLRPYLPDGTPLTTSTEEEQLRIEAEERAEEAEERAEEAERLAKEEAERRQALETELERLRAQLSNRS